MSVAKVSEIICASPKSFEDAIKSGLKRASKTVRNIQGAWVKSQKVVVKGGRITEYRVTLKITFVLSN